MDRIHKMDGIHKMGRIYKKPVILYIKINLVILWIKQTITPNWHGGSGYSTPQ